MKICFKKKNWFLEKYSTKCKYDSSTAFCHKLRTREELLKSVLCCYGKQVSVSRSIDCCLSWIELKISEQGCLLVFYEVLASCALGVPNSCENTSRNVCCNKADGMFWNALSSVLQTSSAWRFAYKETVLFIPFVLNLWLF